MAPQLYARLRVIFLFPESSGFSSGGLSTVPPGRSCEASLFKTTIPNSQADCWSQLTDGVAAYLIMSVFLMLLPFLLLFEVLLQMAFLVLLASMPLQAFLSLQSCCYQCHLLLLASLLYCVGCLQLLAFLLMLAYCGCFKTCCWMCLAVGVDPDDANFKMKLALQLYLHFLMSLLWIVFLLLVSLL